MDRKIPEEWLAVVNLKINEDGEQDEDAPVEPNEIATKLPYHEIPEWEESDMIFLALNTDANKRRTNSKAGGNPAADFEALSEKLLKKYTG